MLALHKMGMKNKPPFGFATLPTLTLSPTLREAASRLRVRGFAIVTESCATTVDSSPGIKHVASKTATPSPLRVYVTGTLRAASGLTKTPRTPRNNFIVTRENKIIPLSVQRLYVL